MSDPFALSFECREAWEQMAELAPGERRCERCSETVVDLSRLTRKQALAVVSVPNPPCVSYLRRQDGTPVFARPTWGNGLLAAAAGLLAACAAPAEEPACELAPEPALEEPAPSEHGAPAAPPVTQTASNEAVPSNGLDRAGAPASTSGPAPTPAPEPRIRRTAGVPRRSALGSDPF